MVELAGEIVEFLVENEDYLEDLMHHKNEKIASACKTILYVIDYSDICIEWYIYLIFH